MSILLGIDKASASDHDKAKLSHLMRDLIDSGYTRVPVANTDRLSVFDFREETIEILPAYEIDRIVKNIDSTK